MESITGKQAEKIEAIGDKNTPGTPAWEKEQARLLAVEFDKSQRAQINEIASLESQNLTGAGSQSAQYGINRKYALQQGDLQLKYHIAQGDYNASIETLNQKFELELEPLKLQLDQEQNVYDQIRGDLSKSEDRLWTAKLDQTRQAIKENEQRQSDISDILQTLQTNNPEVLRNNPNLAVQIGNTKSRGEALQILARNGISLQSTAQRLQEQKLRLDIEKARVDLADTISLGTVASGEYGSVINTASNLLGSEKAKQSRKDIASAIANGDYTTAYATVANNVEQALTGEVKTRFASQRNDYATMYGLRTAIQEYSDAGGDMGLLKGKEEEIKRKLGVDSGNASALAVQLWREFQTYRVNMTGAAFSAAESVDYASVNPTLGKSLNLNLSVIDGAMNQLENRITSTIETRVPGAKNIYQKINPEASMTDDEAYQLYLETIQTP